MIYCWTYSCSSTIKFTLDSSDVTFIWWVYCTRVHPPWCTLSKKQRIYRWILSNFIFDNGYGSPLSNWCAQSPEDDQSLRYSNILILAGSLALLLQISKVCTKIFKYSNRKTNGNTKTNWCYGINNFSIISKLWDFSDYVFLPVWMFLNKILLANFIKDTVYASSSVRVRA